MNLVLFVYTGKPQYPLLGIAMIILWISFKFLWLENLIPKQLYRIAGVFICGAYELVKIYCVFKMPSSGTADAIPNPVALYCAGPFRIFTICYNFLQISSSSDIRPGCALVINYIIFVKTRLKVWILRNINWCFMSNVRKWQYVRNIWYRMKSNLLL